MNANKWLTLISYKCMKKGSSQQQQTQQISTINLISVTSSNIKNSGKSQNSTNLHYCKIMVFSSFKLEIIYYHSFKGNKFLLLPIQRSWVDTTGNHYIHLCTPCIPSKHLKKCLKLQIPYYHLLNQWLLGATNGWGKQW